MLGFVARDGGVLEIELVLAVDIGQVHAFEHASLLAHLGVERRAGHRRVEHELVEIGIVRHGVLDLRADVLRRVVLQTRRWWNPAA